MPHLVETFLPTGGAGALVGPDLAPVSFPWPPPLVGGLIGTGRGNLLGAPGAGTRISSGGPRFRVWTIP
jgi:hypothetical protein